jgi:3-hexulose-6-phosphate synthase / 6-phospho-3-hexuloisomerase
VHPGDWVVGDEDGVVVVPQDRLESVIEAAKRLAVVEKKIEDEVARGKDLATLLRYHELLEKKTSEGVLPQMRFLEKSKE